MKKVSFLINCLIVLVMLSITFSSCSKIDIKQDFILVAHRGGVVDENISENSLQGLEEAIKRGYTHVEIDVRVTKDGHAVCFHDNNLMREVGVNKNISDLTFEELRQLKLLKSHETIPTFEEYCAKCVGKMNVMVDTKGVANQYVETYSKEIENALKKHGLLKEALFIMNRTPINNQDKVADWFLGKAKVSFRKTPEEAKRMEKELNQKLHQYYFVFNSPKDFSKEDINGFQEMGMKIIPSVNMAHYKTGDPMKQGLADVKKMLDWGVDGLQIDSCYDSLVFERKN